MEVFTIRQGSVDTYTETVAGFTSLSGYTAKMYVYKDDGTLLDTVTGTVNATGLTVVYDVLNEDTKSYALGIHHFETKLYDSSDHVYTPSQGFFIVEEANQTDPS